jgi:hypothetical protein
MRQHVFAFVVALAVWVGTSIILQIPYYESAAQSISAGTSVVGLECKRYAAFAFDRATCSTTGPCSGDCYGRMYYWERCEPSQQNGDCTERQKEVDIYNAQKKCNRTPDAWGLCWCNGQWEQRDPTGGKTTVTWCSNP